MLGQGFGKVSNPPNLLTLRRLQDQLGRFPLIVTLERNATINQGKLALSGPSEDGDIDCAQMHRHQPAAKKHYAREGDA
jgi:hypothetical protein